MEMLRDINKNTVDFGDNYDGSEKEPLVLPSRFPNLLVNGSTGIAVGMATIFLLIIERELLMLFLHLSIIRI